MYRTTYELKDGPPATAFNDYEERVTPKYLALIDSATSEKQLQDFLEEHPSFVPGGLTPGTQSGHSPMYEVLIAQPLVVVGQPF